MIFEVKKFCILKQRICRKRSTQDLYKNILIINFKQQMSKHSKNNTSSSVFTYGQRQMLKGMYGTVEQRLGQDSQKTFDMCTICNQRIIEPMTCDKGHIFCKMCILEYLIKQKKEKELKNKKFQQDKIRQQKINSQKNQIQKAKKVQLFEKYQSFVDINARRDFKSGVVEPEHQPNFQTRPIGKYELNKDKPAFTKTSFWAIQHTPQYNQSLKKQDVIILCPGGNHKINRKRLRQVFIKVVENEFCCNLCAKQISRQKVGAYKCGHLVCYKCKGDKCEICSQVVGWIDIESSSSAFAAQGKATVTKYTHAFLS